MCFARRNIVRVTFTDSIASGANVRVDLLPIDNPDDGEHTYHLFVMNSTSDYKAGFHYKVTKTFNTRVTNFFDVYEVSGPNGLRDNGAVTLKFALYGEDNFGVEKGSVFNVLFPGEFSLSPFDSLSARDGGSPMTCSLKQGTWGGDTFESDVITGGVSCKTNSQACILGNDVQFKYEGATLKELKAKETDPTDVYQEF